jgi:lysozyme family protein
MAEAFDFFDAVAFPWVIVVEAAYSDDPADRGNWTGGARGYGELKGTKYGISAKSYPHIDIKNLTLDEASAIYRRDYWGAVRGAEMPRPIALAVFDAAVLHGVDRASKWLQRSLGVVVDGIIGPVTIEATRTAVISRVLPEFQSWRGAHIAAQHDDHYVRGWLHRLFRLDLACVRLVSGSLTSLTKSEGIE